MAFPWFSFQIRVSLAFLFLSVFFAGTSFAQDNLNSELNSDLNDMTLGGKAFDKTPLQKPTISHINVHVNWELWKKVRSKGNAGSNELTALAHDSHSLGIANQPEYAMIITAQAMAAEDPKTARILFDSAESLAPNLPYPFLADAGYFAFKEPLNFPDWGSKGVSGIRNVLTWPDTYYAWMLKFFSFFLIAFSLSALIFTLGQLIRHLPIIVHDATRIMPDGFSNNQSAIILLAVVVVPGVILRSPLISALLMLAFVSLVQNWGERLISALIFLAIVLIPTFDLMVYKYASYYGSRTQKLARAQYLDCDEKCRIGINALHTIDPNDKMIEYTLLLAEYRTGEKKALKRIIKTSEKGWSPEYSGHLQNLKGAAFVALARPKEATEILSKSMTLVKSSAPRFNIMRAYQMQDQLSQASNALNLAVSEDLDRVTEYLRYVRRDVNSFLIVEPIPLSVFHAYKEMEAPKDGLSPVATAWLSLSGSTLHLSQAPFVGFLGLLFVLLGIPVQLTRRSSTPCPKCGLARDPNDASVTGNHRFCLLCYRTFVTGSGMNYEARVYNEHILGRRESLQKWGRRILSIILPGAGHHLAGRSIPGFLISFLLGFGILTLIQPLGVVRAPLEHFTNNWAGQTTVAWILVSLCFIISLYAAVRDIPPVIAKGSK